MTGGSPAAAPPSVPQEFRGIDDLGAPRAVVRVPLRRRVPWSAGLLALWAISIFIAGVLVALVASIFLELDDLVTLGIAGVVWIGGLWFVAGWLRRKGAQVIVLYADGMAVGDGRSVRRWRWEEFASVERHPVVTKPDVPTDLAGAIGLLAALAVYQVANRPIVRVESHYRFVDRAGGAFTLDRWLPEVDELADVIDAEITTRLLPAARTLLASGREVGFGEVGLRWDTVAVGGRPIPLARYERAEVDRDELRVHEGGASPATAKIGRISNLNLLLSLLAELTAGR